MKEKNQALYDAAVDAITELFSDQSVSKEQAKSNLQGLKEEINTMIESLELD